MRHVQGARERIRARFEFGTAAVGDLAQGSRGSRLGVPRQTRRGEILNGRMSETGSNTEAVRPEARFHASMVALYETAKRDLGYNATRFLQMISEHGGVEAARRLLRAPAVSDGFTTLWEGGRLDLSVEAHVLLPEFQALFSEGERETAKRRLADYGYKG